MNKKRDVVAARKRGFFNRRRMGAYQVYKVLSASPPRGARLFSVIFVLSLGVGVNATTNWLHCLLGGTEKGADVLVWGKLTAYCVALVAISGFAAWVRITDRLTLRSIDEIHPRKALVWVLSSFLDREKKGVTMEHLLGAAPDCLEEVAKPTNWLLFIEAVRYHSPALKVVYLICTKEVVPQFSAAEQLIRKVTGRNTKVFRVEIENHLDVEEAQIVIENVYRLATRKEGLALHDIITDITGGPRAVGFGMALGTLDHDRDVQYYDPDRAAQKFRFITTDPKLVSRYSSDTPETP
jgi:hypothetical protein